MDLNLSLNIVDGVAALDFESYSFSGQGFDEDLHGSSEFSDAMLFLFGSWGREQEEGG